MITSRSLISFSSCIRYLSQSVNASQTTSAVGNAASSVAASAVENKQTTKSLKVSPKGKKPKLPSEKELRSFRGYIDKRNTYVGVHEVPKIVVRSKSKEELENKIKEMKSGLKPLQSIKLVSSTTPTNAVVYQHDEKKPETTSKAPSKNPVIGSFIFPQTQATTTDGANATKSGRSWEASEIRKKSIADLHALWFVLLAERNKLLSERFQARKDKRQMQGYERLRKVKQSMARIMTVLRERELEAIKLGLPKNAVYEEILQSNESLVAKRVTDQKKKPTKSAKPAESTPKSDTQQPSSSSTTTSLQSEAAKKKEDVKT